MNPESVLEKTTKGVEEIETRKHKLDAKLRPLLIAINGKLKAAELASQFAALGDANALLDDLLKQGFVRAAAGTPQPGAGGGASDPARLKKAVSEATRFISEALGPGGDGINMKIEAMKSLDDLNALLDAQRNLLDSALGKVKAAQFWQKIGPLLG
jgi:hypothetical protein